jgi:hypothetical protein
MAGIPRADVNGESSATARSNTHDLLRIVQLLNGINTTRAWNGASLAPCP